MGYDLPMPTDPPKRRYHWTVRVAACLLLLVIAVLGALYFTGERIAESILREKLQALVSQELNARLEMGAVDYHFPYGLSVADVSIITRGPDGGDLKLMSFKSLGLTVAKIPLRKGPLVIERIDIDHPTLHVIRTSGGFIGENSLVRSEAEKKRDTEPPPPLSEVLKLRHIAFNDGRIEYDDRTTAGNLPLVWENLDANFDSQPIGEASHRFAFTADNGDAAKIESAGTIDLDSLILQVEKMKITTAVHARQTNRALPAEVQKVLTASGIAGDAILNVHGTVPLLHTRDLDASADLQINNGHCMVPGLPEPVQDLTLIAAAEYQHGKVHAQINRFACRTASIGLSVEPLSGTFNRDSGRWLVDQIKAAIVYEPVDSSTNFWRQKLTAVLRCAPHQLDDKSRFETVLDGTTITPQGLAGDLNIDGTAVYGDRELTVRPTTISGCGGMIGLTGVANFRTHAYDAKITAQKVELAKVNVIVDPLATKEMKGELSGQVRLTVINTIDSLAGEGGFRITDGKFARVPVLSQVADFLHFGQGAVEANDAFGHFKIADHSFNFDRMAISTSVLRIRGQGMIGFDEKLALKVYADSASNWQKDVKRTGIPVLSDIVGAVVGGTQSVIGGVSKQFTTLSVTGTISKPKITPAPAPLLTENLNKLFRAVE